MKKLLIVLHVLIINLGLLAQSDFAPSISPDGKKVAFYRYVEKVPQIFVMNIEGTNLQQLTQHDQLWSIGPIWSRDMSKIYFSHGENMSTMDVSTMIMETKEITRIKREGMQFALGESGQEFIWASKENGFKFYSSLNSNLEDQILIDVDNFGKYWVHVSAYGTFIVVSDEGKEGVYQKENDALKALIKMKNIKNLSVSPDGTKLIFESKINDVSDIFIADIDGKNIQNLTSSQSTDYMPSFSPNSDFIIFSSNRSGSFCLFILELESNQLAQLTGL